MVPDELSADTPTSKEHETQSTASPKLALVDGSTEFSELISRPDDPVPMSLDSEGPVQESSPSDESWTELYDSACGDTARDGEGGAGETLSTSGFYSREAHETRCPSAVLRRQQGDHQGALYTSSSCFGRPAIACGSGIVHHGLRSGAA